MCKLRVFWKHRQLKVDFHDKVRALNEWMSVWSIESRLKWEVPASKGGFHLQIWSYCSTWQSQRRVANFLKTFQANFLDFWHFYYQGFSKYNGWSEGVNNEELGFHLWIWYLELELATNEFSSLPLLRAGWMNEWMSWMKVAAIIKQAWVQIWSFCQPAW